MRALDSPKPPPSRAVRARSRHVATPHARPYGAMRTRAPHQRRVIRTVVVTRGRRRVVNPRHAPTARTRAHRVHHSNVPSCPRGARVRVTKRHRAYGVRCHIVRLARTSMRMRECARGVRVVVECRARCARTFGFAIRIVNLMRAQDTRARTRSARYVVFGGGLSTGWRGRDWWIMHDIEGVLMGPARKWSVGHIDARSFLDIYLW